MKKEKNNTGINSEDNTNQLNNDQSNNGLLINGLCLTLGGVIFICSQFLIFRPLRVNAREQIKEVVKNIVKETSKETSSLPLSKMRKHVETIRTKYVRHKNNINPRKASVNIKISPINLNILFKNMSRFLRKDVVNKEQNILTNSLETKGDSLIFTFILAFLSNIFYFQSSSDRSLNFLNQSEYNELISRYKMINNEPTIEEQVIEIFTLSQLFFSNNLVGEKDEFRNLFGLIIFRDIAKESTTGENKIEPLNLTGGYQNLNAEHLINTLEAQEHNFEHQKEQEIKNLAINNKLIDRITSYLLRNKKAYVIFLIMSAIVLVFSVGLHLIYGTKNKLMFDKLKSLAALIDSYFTDLPDYLDRFLSSIFDIFSFESSCKKMDFYIELRKQLRASKKELKQVKGEILILQKAKQAVLEEMQELIFRLNFCNYLRDGSYKYNELQATKSVDICLDALNFSLEEAKKLCLSLGASGPEMGPISSNENSF
jgi:hypothetical protein